MLAKFASDKILKKLENLEEGSLNLTMPDGKVRSFQGRRPGRPANVEVRDWSVLPNLVTKGNIGFCDDYRGGKWEADDLQALLEIGLINSDAFQKMVVGQRSSRLKAMMSYLFKMNTLRGSKKNIHAHYDLGNAFYQLWLDPTMTYSAALYKGEGDSLPLAQLNKYDRMIDRLECNSGSIMEIGCGWGGFADRATEKGDFNIRGVTISEEQHQYAQERLRGKPAEIVLEDYRRQNGKFDNIISIEMFEAVGERYWKTYFDKVKSMLNAKGKAVIQTITIREQDFEQYRYSGDFIRSYIFPGGMLPSESAFVSSAEKSGLKVCDSFAFGQDYSRTLTEWLKTFDAKRTEVKRMGFDDSFIRLWRFYLAACAAGFKTGRTDVLQVELQHA